MSYLYPYLLPLCHPWGVTFMECMFVNSSMIQSLTNELHQLEVVVSFHISGRAEWTLNADRVVNRIVSSSWFQSSWYKLIAKTLFLTFVWLLGLQVDMFTQLHVSQVGKLGTHVQILQRSFKHYICQSLVQMRGGTQYNIHLVCICNLYWLAQTCAEEVKLWQTGGWTQYNIHLQCNLCRWGQTFKMSSGTHHYPGLRITRWMQKPFNNNETKTLGIAE